MAGFPFGGDTGGATATPVLGQTVAPALVPDSGKESSFEAFAFSPLKARAA